MTSSHNSSQLMGTRRGKTLLQLFNIVNEKQTGITGTNNVETSPVAPHFSTLSINSKSLLMKNVVAPNLGGSLNQFFSRLTQGVVFAFLRGECKVEELPCLDSPDEKMPAVEKDDQEITQVKDVVPSQSSIFDFLKGDFCQFLIFLVDFDLGSEKQSLLDLSSSSDGSDDTSYSIQDIDPCSTTSHEPQLTDHYARAHDDVEWMFTDAVVKDDGCSGEIDENILYSPFHHWQKMLKDDPLSDFVMENAIINPHQCYGIENCHGIMPKLNCNAGIFEQTFKLALENYGFVIGNHHEETVARIPILLPSSESIMPSLVYSQFHEELNKNCVSTSTYAQSFASFSHSQMEWFMGINDNTGCHCGNNDSSNDCGTSVYTSSEVFGTFEQQPAIRNSKNLKLSIPDPDKLMDYLHGSLSSPKFLASDLLNGESDNFYFSSLLRIRNSDEVAKSDNLSGSCSTTSHELQLTNPYAKVHDDVEWMKTDAIVKDDDFSGEIDENVLYSPFHHWHKMIKNDPLTDFSMTANLYQCYGSDSENLIMTMFALENSGFVIGNYHKGTVVRTPILLSSSESLVPLLVYSQFDEELNKNCVSTSTYAQSFASFSHLQMEWFREIHNNTTSHCGITDSSNDCDIPGHSFSEVFGAFEQHPAIGNTEELTFCIPDPDELMKYLYGPISSPKFLASDPSNGESDNFHFSSRFGICNSYEVAKSDNLSDSITNSLLGDGGNENKYGMFDTLDHAIESGIGATTGAFGEIEASSIPYLPDTSRIEKIRWNWSSQEVYFSSFGFDDHQDLLELYGLSEQDVQANDDLFCDSPNWLRKL